MWSYLNLGEDLKIFKSFHFPVSGLYLLNGFDFDFDSENQHTRL